MSRNFKVLLNLKLISSYYFVILNYFNKQNRAPHHSFTRLRRSPRFSRRVGGYLRERTARRLCRSVSESTDRQRDDLRCGQADLRPCLDAIRHDGEGGGNFETGRMVDGVINDRKAADGPILTLSRAAVEAIQLPLNRTAPGSLLVI